VSGTVFSGSLDYGCVRDFPDPYSATISGEIIDLGIVAGDIEHAVIDTVLQSGINWDGKTECSHIYDVDLSDFNAASCEADRAVISSVVGYHIECDYPVDDGNDFVVGAHTTNRGTLAPVKMTMLYPVYQGYGISTTGGEFDNDALVGIFVGGLNKKRNYKEAFYNYWFRTKKQQQEDLGAYISVIRKDRDLNATIIPVAPVHRKGETVTVKIYALDEEGNVLNYEFQYTIEE
jgi:hypothetical protein